MHILRLFVERELDGRDATPSTARAAAVAR